MTNKKIRQKTYRLLACASWDLIRTILVKDKNVLMIDEISKCIFEIVVCLEEIWSVFETDKEVNIGIPFDESVVAPTS